MRKPSFRHVWIRGLQALLALAALAAAAPAGAQTPALVNAVSPGVTIGPAHPAVTLPVNLSRDNTSKMLGFSIKIQLSPELSALNTGSDVALGNFLTDGGRATQLQVVDNGGGLYTVDGVTLGASCGPTTQSGTLFTVTLRSTAVAGPGTVSIQSVTLRDCDNQTIAADPGSSASVSIDNTGPSVTVSSPNGGESWAYQTTHDITWSASDAAGVASVDLDYSTNGGGSWISIATGETNDGTYAWAVPNTPSTNALVRVTAHDVNGNTASDASDGAFTLLSNTAPVLGAIGNRAVDELTLLTFTATATDGEAPPQTLTFSLDAGAPAGASIDPGTGVFTWTPTEAQGPASYPITVRVTDNGTPQLDDFETITVSVAEVNAPPVLSGVPASATIPELAPYTFTASATDPDVPVQTLTFSLVGAPAGAAIDRGRGCSPGRRARRRARAPTRSRCG